MAVAVVSGLVETASACSAYTAALYCLCEKVWHRDAILMDVILEMALNAAQVNPAWG